MYFSMAKQTDYSFWLEIQDGHQRSPWDNTSQWEHLYLLTGEPKDSKQLDSIGMYATEASLKTSLKIEHLFSWICFCITVSPIS